MINKRIFKTAAATFLFTAATMTFSSTALAAPVITPTLDGNTLVNALLGGGGVGIDLSSVTFNISGNSSPDHTSAGTYTGATEYGIAPGIILSSGGVDIFGTSSSVTFMREATAEQQELLFPISGKDEHNDVTQFDIFFDMLPGYDSIFFNVTFQSVEFPDFVGQEFIDAFGLYVNGINIAYVAGEPINIDHPFMGNDVANDNGVLGSNPAQVGNNASGALFHTFTSKVNATGNKITFIIADSGDSALDSFAFISQLGGSAPPVATVPVPATLGLMGIGFLAALGMGLRRRRQG